MVFVRIQQTGVLVPCERGADGEYLEDGMSLEDAFKAHGKFIDPLRGGNEGLAAQPEGPEPLGVRALDFAGCGLRNAPVRKLAHILKVNTTITRLNLAWNEIGSKGVSYLADSLLRNSTLAHLDLSHNEIEDSGAQRLAASLGGDEAALRLHGIIGSKTWYRLEPNYVPAGDGNITLRKLALECNPIQETGRRELLTAVAYNGGLETLSLGGGIFVGRDHQLLGESLWCNWHVTTLDLSDADIQTDGAKELAKVISRPHGTIQALNLSRNKLGNEGATALARALFPITLADESLAQGGEPSETLITEHKFEKTFSSSSYVRSDPEIVQPSLTCLDLTNNQVGPTGLIEIALALRKNNSLKTLILSDNKCEDKGGTALANSLKQNTSIENMFFYDNTIQLDATSAITEILSASAYLKHTDMVFSVGHDLQKRQELAEQTRMAARSRPPPIKGASVSGTPARRRRSENAAAFEFELPQVTPQSSSNSKATPKCVAEVPPPQTPLTLASPLRQDFGFLDDDDDGAGDGKLGLTGMRGQARTDTG